MTRRGSTCRAILESDTSGRPCLSAREIHHLVRVRRLGAGDVFQGLNRSESAWYECRLQSRGSEWDVQVLDRIGTVGESPLQIVLGAALIKKGRFEWMIQKACELGVSQIVPLMTRYVEDSLARSAGRLGRRWKTILEESVKQCGRSRAPEMRPVTGLDEFLDSSSRALQIVLDRTANHDLREIEWEPGESSSRVALLIGPEGGWSGRERKLFAEYEARHVFLGPRILRAETAALCAVSLVQYRWGDLGCISLARPAGDA